MSKKTGGRRSTSFQIFFTKHSVIFWPNLAKSEPLFGKPNNSINSYDDDMVWYNWVKIMQNNEKSCKIMQKSCKISKNHANFAKSCTWVSTLWPAKKIMKNDIWYMGVNPLIEVRNISDMSFLGYLDLWEMWEKTYYPDFPGFFFLDFSLQIYPKSILELRTQLRSTPQKNFSQKGANRKSKNNTVSSNPI